MKKKLLAALMILSALNASALTPGIFDHLGLGVGIGTTGITIEAATPITSFVQVRAGVSIVPSITFKADADIEYSTPWQEGRVDDAELKGDLGRVQGQLIFNVYPIPKCNFFIAAGAYFGGDKLIKIKGHSDELQKYASEIDGVVIGDYKLPCDNEGNVSGGIKVNSFRPYLGIGFGRVVPGKLLSFNTELGVQIHGKPKLYTDYGTLDLMDEVDDNTFNKIMEKVTIYPTLTFRLNFRAL